MPCFRIVSAGKAHRSQKITRHLVGALFVLFVLLILCDVQGLRKFAVYYAVPSFRFINSSDMPPSYTNLKQWEKNLPQHNLDLPFPEGKSGRYVLFTSSQVEILGWNNKFINILMDNLLAYKANRTYVFYDFTWPDKHYPWPIHKYREWKPHTPLNAFISGPTAGGPWYPGDSAPRAISDKWFDVVCPVSERRYINTHDVKPEIYWEEGSVIFDHWRRILADAPERCIEVIPPPPETDGTPQVFDMHLWGSGRSLSLWEEFKQSPVSQLLSASAIVESAIEANLPLFTSDNQTSFSSTPNSTPFGNTLSVHIRRGDYKRQCRHFWTWSSSFYNWNLLPFLPDRFDPPPGFSWGANIPENLPRFLERCFPEIPTIVKRIREVKEDFIKSTKPAASSILKVIYIMTNDHTSWLDDLRLALARDGWELVLTSSDLTLNAEQTDVGVAVDMEIGRQSAVFIGNGWSSFTSNVVHQRLVDGKDTTSIRFL